MTIIDKKVITKISWEAPDTMETLDTKKLQEEDNTLTTTVILTEWWEITAASLEDFPEMTSLEELGFSEW